LTCLRLPKIAAEPLGAAKIFKSRIQAKHLYSLSALAPQNQDYGNAILCHFPLPELL
jgi:hypothetical protein